MTRRPERESAELSETVAGTGGGTLPTLTHLQFLVLDLIQNAHGAIAAQQLQGALAAAGVEHRGPKFYQLMKRLEEGGYVESKQQAFSVAGGEVQRTAYGLHKSGHVAWRLTREFYATRLQLKKSVK